MLERVKRKNALTPFRGLFDIQSEMNKLFDDFFGSTEVPSILPEFVPAIDISETKNELRVKADLPGLSEKDVEVTISGDVLTIKGKKEEEKCEQNENYYRKERSFGSFVRQIPLPTKIKENEVKAKFKNGILHIVMPKSEEEVAKGIKIEVEK